MKSMKRVGLAALLVLAAAAPPLAQQQPRFQSGVELLPIDVTVVDDRGRPIEHLAPADFTVRIDDQPRGVVSAQWIPRLTAAGTGAGAPPPVTAEGYYSNAAAAGSGLVVIAVDEANIKAGTMRPMLPAVTRFIDRLAPADRIAIVSFGLGTSSWSDFTSDWNAIKAKAAQMPGQLAATEPPWSFRVGIGAALAELRGEQDALSAVISRACAGAQFDRAQANCPQRVKLEAASVAALALRNADLTINGLRELLTVLKTVDAPKTLLLISDGFALDRSVGHRRVVELGDLAAAARTTIYSLKLEEEPINITEPGSRTPFETQQDQIERRQGLELLAQASRGGLLTLSGTGTGAFDRIESEMSGYYLLGVESTPRDRDGPRALQVGVARPGVTVRARRAMTIDPGATPQSPHDRANAALANPLMLAGVPLRGTAVALRGPDRSKIQVLVHADIETTRGESRVITVAYVILDEQQRAAEGQISDLRIGPAAGTGATVPYARTATVGPGNYTVRIAVVDGDRIGSVEVPLRAELMRAGALEVTELVVGGPDPQRNPSQPTLGPEVRFGLVQGYFEAYGQDAAGLTATFEVVTESKGPAVSSGSVSARRGGDERFIFSRVVPVGELPPGVYWLRATLSAATPIVKVRPFEVVAEPAAAGPVFLTVNAAHLGRPFDLDSALAPATVQSLRARSSAPTTAAFDEALGQLRNRAYVDAATALERSIEGGVDQGAALAYLGVCFAAAGHDDEAMAAWRKAAAGADVPEVHAWVIDALLRTKRFGEARAATDVASARWPADATFARPLAILNAIGGNARDAMLALDRYLDQHRGDEASLFLALSWLFEAKRAGLAVRERSEDVRLARRYAEQYAALNGTRQPLVNVWIDYLER